MTFGKMFTAVAVILLAQALAMATEIPQTPATRPAAALQAQLQRLTMALDSLNLTDAQKAQVKQIMADFRQQMATLRQDNKNLTQPERREKITALFRDLRKQLMQVLDPEQQKELAKQLGDANGEGGGGILQRLRTDLDKLDLTADQKTDIDELLKSNAGKFREIMEKRRQGEDVKGEVQELMQDIRTKLQSILTPEQAAQLREMLQSQRPTSRPSAE